MLLEMFTILKIMVVCLVKLIPYGLLAIYPALICTKMATDSWTR